MRVSEVDSIVEEILNKFDFEKVRVAMFAVDWKWYEGHAPAVEELREAARRLLLAVCAEKSEDATASCGGFEAFKSRGEVSLGFTLEWHAVERSGEVL